jgi:hypothetical protein
VSEFRADLTKLVNRHSKENGSNTPDYILAEYLERCLNNFDLTVAARDRWESEAVCYVSTSLSRAVEMIAETVGKEGDRLED